ncbi:MAG: protein kinase [Polyangiaceae bacterium]|nr:protein kinase [Polyangiaceae bacterium]
MILEPEPLRIKDPELRDLVTSRLPLVEATTGHFTGITLTRLVGVGGMSTVFQADFDPAFRSHDLWERTPRSVAVKIMKPATVMEIQLANASLDDIFKREVIALGRVMERVPPTEFVVGCYGSGLLDVLLGKTPMRLPWLALELVSSGALGVSLTARVEREPEGIDPIRALRLIRGIIHGVRILHEERIIHRDLKPDNVLVVGPVDDETPKLSDCGIARVDGVGTTLAGMTYAYGAPEQILSSPKQRNPLVGVWTDVHALAAVVWFIIGGEDWCRDDNDPEWAAGKRRSLLYANRVHYGFHAEGELFSRIDQVLQRGAASKLPDGAWTVEARKVYERAARMMVTSLFEGVERYPNVDAFAADLLPLLEKVADKWKTRARKEKRAATTLRSPKLAAAEKVTTPILGVAEHPARWSSNAQPSAAPNGPVLAVYQPDGRILALFGSQLVSIIHGEAAVVGVKPDVARLLEKTKWMVRGPIAGFALVGSSHVLLIGRSAEPTLMNLPKPQSGAPLGPIVATVGDGRMFGIITADAENVESDLELWVSENGVSWSEAYEVPLGGTVHAMVNGTSGLFVVGGKRGAAARALQLGHDEICRIMTQRLRKRPPFLVAVAGVGKDCWAAGEDCIVRLDGDSVETEGGLPFGIPVAMALDVVGIPWLMTKDKVLRRHGGGSAAEWIVYHRRSEDKPAFVAIGFTAEGVHVLDAAGNTTLLVPHDIHSFA